MKEASFYKKNNGDLQCTLCPHFCVIKNEKSGICRVRTNHDSILYSDIYGEVTAAAMDPIEKKPLYHFYPSSSIFSIGTKGCNFKCNYCQNHRISQNPYVDSENYSPDEIVDAAVRSNAMGIAYTYSEPIIWIEFVLDCAKLARNKGLKNVMVTNGYINEEPLSELLKVTDAMNIDLKTFDDKTSSIVHKGNLSNVKKTIEQVCHSSCHLEVTTLIVTDINDTLEEMTMIADFLSENNDSIPWHLSRYHPEYKYNAPATNIDLMMNVYAMAQKKLKYVYCGNIPSNFDGSDTHCPQCNNVLIKRSGYMVEIVGIKNGKCKNCNHKSAIVQ